MDQPIREPYFYEFRMKENNPRDWSREVDDVIKQRENENDCKHDDDEAYTARLMAVCFSTINPGTINFHFTK